MPTDCSSYQEKDRAHFTRWAPYYDAGISGCFFRKSYRTALRAVSLRSHQHILDLGCGTGRFIHALLETESTLSIVGIDYTIAMLNRAREKFRNDLRVTLLWESAEQLSVPSHSIDIIYCLDAFHHFSAPDTVFAHMKRALKPNGLIVILDPVNDGWRKPLMNIATPLLGEEHARVYSKKEWREMFRRHELRIERDYSWLLFFHIFVISTT